MRIHASTRFATLLPVAILLAGSTAARAETSSSTTLEGAAPPVSLNATNLIDHERFWPYQIRLVRDFAPPDGSRTLPAGTPGVLIRIEEGGIARADFSQLGLQDVPIESTNIVERAREHASGKRRKMADNFVLAVGPRLFDSDHVVPKPWEMHAASGYDGYLCVFADPTSDGFDELVRAITALTRNRPRLVTLLFPQGGVSDMELMEILDRVDWKVPFMRTQLSEIYTETLIDESVARPAVALNTPAGRLLFEGSWSDETRAKLGELLETRFARSSGTSGTANTASQRQGS